ncbi:hypothetical protein AZE42_02495 [Rhizopogon vesiculosus]|uniref:Uncharacterized protein n=1 Tax=Rhizopogon vesiculosus TaxID=180088 RepID=A0A1J8RE87_9AGAM|nr:hypothetical protein AZE42_02495 [Rhizopogon vesiculosus]
MGGVLEELREGRYTIQVAVRNVCSGYPEYDCPGITDPESRFWYWQNIFEVTFISSSIGTTFHLLSKKREVAYLISSIQANCSSNLASSTSMFPSPFDDSASGCSWLEQVIQYCNDYSVVLTLDGYNNSNLNSPNTTTKSPLPSGIDTTLLNCLNYTIGQAAPPFDGASMQFTSPPCLGVVSFVWILWLLLHYA